MQRCAFLGENRPVWHTNKHIAIAHECETVFVDLPSLALKVGVRYTGGVFSMQTP